MIQALSSTPSGVLSVMNSGRTSPNAVTFAARAALSASVRTSLPSARRHASDQRAITVEQVHLVVAVALGDEQELFPTVDPTWLVRVHPRRVAVGHDYPRRTTLRVGEQQVEPVLVAVEPGEPDLVRR